MIVAHLSDLHLGFQAYDALSHGRNVRSRDVEQAFLKAVQELVRLEPDLVLLAGDLLDHPHPDSSALVSLTRGIHQLREGLPDTPILAVAGERDTPLQRVEPGVLAALDTYPGLEVATGAPRSVFIRDRETHVLLLPHRAIRRAPFPALRPDPGARFNLLVLHGRLEPEGGVPLPAEGWDYVALGHEHGFRQVASRMVYPGALERVSPDPWREAMEEKGFVTFDVASGEMEFHVIPGRPVVELAPVRFDPANPADVNRRIRDSVEVIPGGIDGKLVRLRIEHLPGSRSDPLDSALLAELRERSVHLQVEFDPAPPERIVLTHGGAPGPERWIARAADRSGVDARGVEAVREVLAALSGGPSSEPPPAAPAVLPASLDELPVGTIGVFGPPMRPDPLSTDPALDPLRAAVEVLSAHWGGREIRRAILALSPSAAPVPAGNGLGAGGPAPSPGDLDSLEDRIAQGEEAARRLPAWERELVELRAEEAVVAGDLEAAMTDWLREKQDAETHLLAYRDRARELKSRLGQVESAGGEAECPTCGQVLRERAGELAATLREEWEAVVQDGQWWKSRLEQLEAKPPPIREQESREIRIRAAIHELVERIERGRAALGDLDDLRERRRQLQTRADGRVLEGELALGERRRSLAAQILREALDLLEGACLEELEARASVILNRITSGRLSGLRPGGGGVEVLRDGGVLERPDPGERAALELALRLAAFWSLEDAHGSLPPVFQVGEEGNRIPPDAQRNLLRALVRLSRSGVRVLIRTSGPLVQWHADMLTLVAALSEEEGGALRVLPAGPPILHLTGEGRPGHPRSRSRQLPNSIQASARSR